MRIGPEVLLERRDGHSQFEEPSHGGNVVQEVLTSAQQLTTEEQARLIEDLLQDAAWARDYEARKAAGQLTPAELDVLPWDEALEE